MKRLAKVPLPEDIQREMAQSKIYALLRLNPAFTKMNKTEISRIVKELINEGASDFIKNLNLKTILEMPYIYSIDEKHIIEIDNRQYYVVSVTAPKTAGKKQTIDGVTYQKGEFYPGKIVCMDVETGSPVEFNYTEVVDRIKRSDEPRRETLNKVNEEIGQWNKKLSEIENSTGLTRLNLQVVAAEKKIEARISELNNMQETLRASAEDPLTKSPAYGRWLEYLKENYRTFGPKDILDTLMFLYQSNPQELVQGIQNDEIEVPDEIRPALLGIASQLALKMDEARIQDESDRARRERDIEEEITEDKDTELGKIKPYELEDIPFSPYEKPKKYQTLHHWSASLKRSIESMERDKNELERILASLYDLRLHVANMPKKKEDLATPSGQRAANSMEEFMDKAKIFLKRYKEKIVIDGKVNPKLLGRDGTIGNALIAARLHNIYNIIAHNLKSIKELEIELPEMEVEVTPERDTERDPTLTFTKEKILKISKYLHESFENKNKIRK